jgi:hypothetical protein
MTVHIYTAQSAHKRILPVSIFGSFYSPQAAMQNIPLDKAELIAIFLETFLYGER